MEMACGRMNACHVKTTIAPYRLQKRKANKSRFGKKESRLYKYYKSKMGRPVQYP